MDASASEGSGYEPHNQMGAQRSKRDGLEASKRSYELAEPAINGAN